VAGCSIQAHVSAIIGSGRCFAFSTSFSRTAFSAPGGLQFFLSQTSLPASGITVALIRQHPEKTWLLGPGVSQTFAVEMMRSRPTKHAVGRYFPKTRPEIDNRQNRFLPRFFGSERWTMEKCPYDLVPFGGCCVTVACNDTLQARRRNHRVWDRKHRLANYVEW
jgi:hypothetical protein